MAENFNIDVITTPGYSPWSNALLETGGSREKSDQGSTRSSWAWLYVCGKYLRTMNKKGPVGPTFIIDLKFDLLDFSKEAINHVVHFVLFS